MFWDKLSADQWEAARSTAAMLGLQLSGIELRESPYDYEAAFDQAPLDHRDMLIVPTSPSFFAIARALPTSRFGIGSYR